MANDKVSCTFDFFIFISDFYYSMIQSIDADN